MWLYQQFVDLDVLGHRLVAMAIVGKRVKGNSAGSLGLSILCHVTSFALRHPGSALPPIIIRIDDFGIWECNARYVLERESR